MSQDFSAATLDIPTTKVQFYRGIEGSKQTLWNQTRAKTETCSILHENIQTRAYATFFERWVQRCNERNMHFRGIVDDNYINTQKSWYATHQNERLKNWQSRYIAPDVFSVHHSTVVYDNVVCHYIWKDNEIFSIEIHNAEIAEAQRQYFNLLWKQAVPRTVKIKGEEVVP
jgi:hypothetical protein